MSTRRHNDQRRSLDGLFISAILGGAISIGAALVPAGLASASTSATFALGVLTVTGDAQDNTITVGRDAAGNLLVNGGAVPIRGGTPTIANTRTISLVGGAGHDTLALDEANGALPRASLFGGAGNDALTGGAAGDTMVGQAGEDILTANGGADTVVGGPGNDMLTGGDGNDQLSGEAGEDRMIWNPGDDTDRNEGGSEVDTTEVNGDAGPETFTATANGARVRFDRVDPAPFSLDLGTVEHLVVNANGDNDAFAATGDLAALIAITVDGGEGDDTLRGSNGADTLFGGAGLDFVDGQQGNDFSELGGDDDVFQWDPGDGSDVIEGADGIDTMLFNGSNGAEDFDVSANGERVRFTRNLGTITMDTNDVESIHLNTLGNTDKVFVNDVSGTDLTDLATNLSSPLGSGSGDGQADNVIVRGSLSNDVSVVAGSGPDMQVAQVTTNITVSGADPALDRLTVAPLDGDDLVDASGIAAGSMLLSLDGDLGHDILIGGSGDDTIAGGEGDDVLIGGPGFDTLDGGPGEDTLIDGEVVTDGLIADTDWLDKHTKKVDGKTVLHTGRRSVVLPVADLVPQTPPGDGS